MAANATKELSYKEIITVLKKNEESSPVKRIYTLNHDDNGEFVGISISKMMKPAKKDTIKVLPKAQENKVGKRQVFLF
jgi:hypothetical protein